LFFEGFDLHGEGRGFGLQRFILFLKLRIVAECLGNFGLKGGGFGGVVCGSCRRELVDTGFGLRELRANLRLSLSEFRLQGCHLGFRSLLRGGGGFQTRGHFLIGVLSDLIQARVENYILIPES
jgi:hypothetical protein